MRRKPGLGCQAVPGGVHALNVEDTGRRLETRTGGPPATPPSRFFGQRFPPTRLEKAGRLRPSQDCRCGLKVNRTIMRDTLEQLSVYKKVRNDGIFTALRARITLVGSNSAGISRSVSLNPETRAARMVLRRTCWAKVRRVQDRD
jgi:hypothetical protein